MSHKIVSVAPGSPAQIAGICPGDRLISIDGEIVHDFLDYQALCARSRVDVKTTGGSYSVKKGRYADMGLSFETPMMSGVRLCANDCRFCFVAQLPAYARDSLRVKDDDWRMSLMMGNYVSLTNVADAELDRMIRRHASPLYISVHATDPALRADMMGTPRAARLPEQLKRLREGGISFHTQAVLCPGMNDGIQLERTISELAALRPGCLSLALAPVGLTCHREGLYPLRKYTRDEARAVINIADKWREKMLAETGTRFVFPSDEFYLAAGMDLPKDEEYEDYGQIDDGVGMLRLFYEQYAEAWRGAEFKPLGEARCALVCGVSARDFFEALLSEMPIPGANVDVIGAENRFFGETVTVSGLLTGGDILAALSGKGYKRALFSASALRPEDGIFLDGMTPGELESALGAELTPVGRGGGELFEAIKRIAEEENG